MPIRGKECKFWCTLHKWCSKCYKYESAGKCEYSTQIYAKVSFPTSSPTISNENTPTTDSKSRPLVAVGRDIEENIGSISFKTDTNTLETGFHS
jgi:hypothetical protein